MTMGAYADCVPQQISTQKFTGVKITADKTLVTKDGRSFAAGADLQSIFLLNGFFPGNQQVGLKFHFTPSFLLAKKQVLTFKFDFTLDDGRTFGLQSGQHELLAIN